MVFAMIVLSLFRGLINVPQSMREIATLVAERHGLTLEELRGPSRKHRVSRPRQEAMAFMRAEGRFSYPQIARYFGKDHTTVLHAVRAHAARYEMAEQARAA